MKVSGYQILLAFFNPRKFLSLEMRKEPYSISSRNIVLLNNKKSLNNKLIDLGFEEYIPSLKPSNFPQIYKPINGKKSESIKIINAPLEIEKEFFIQEYIKSDYEYAAIIMANKGKIISKFVLEYNVSDIDIRIDNSFGKIVREPVICKDNDNGALEKVIKGLNYSGICTVQYFVVQGKIKIFEINPFLVPDGDQFIDDIIYDVYKDYIKEEQNENIQS